MTNTFVKPAHVVAVLLISCNVGAAGFFPLGDLAGGDDRSKALGISDDGLTVVGRGHSASGNEAFLWTSSGMQGLGVLTGASSSLAAAASGDGSIVVGVSNDPDDSTEAFIWSSGGGMQGLGVLTGGVSSFANAVSGDGSIVVGGADSPSGPEAFIWTSGGGMVMLGDLTGGTYNSEATGISSDGMTVVGSSVSALGPEAFIWASGGSMVGLGALNLTPGFFYSRANGVSGDGTTVVGTSWSSRFEAFGWNSDDGMQGLGVLDGSSLQSDAYAASSDGSAIVGASSPSAGNQDAFVWTSDGGMQSVYDLATSQGITGHTGWSLTYAYGISGDGSTIVGEGINTSGDTEAWMIVLPDTDADGRPDYIDNCPNDPNASQQDSDGNGTGDVCDSLLITTTSLPSGRAGKFYSKQLVAVGGTPPYTWTILSGSPPFDVSLDTNGLFSGEVQSTFLTFFTVQVMDSTGSTDTQNLSISVTLPNCVNCHTALGL